MKLKSVKNEYANCYSCRAKDDLKELSVPYSRHGSMNIVLCKDCREKLYYALEDEK